MIKHTLLDKLIWNCSQLEIFFLCQCAHKESTYDNPRQSAQKRKKGKNTDPTNRNVEQFQTFEMFLNFIMLIGILYKCRIV